MRDVFERRIRNLPGYPLLHRVARAGLVRLAARRHRPLEQWSDPARDSGPSFRMSPRARNSAPVPRPAGAPEQVGAQPTLRPPSAPGGEASPRWKGPDDGLRCLLVTGALDAGGMDEVVGILARQLTRYGLRVAVLAIDPAATPDGAPLGRIGKALAAAGVPTSEVREDDVRAHLDRWRPDVLSVHGVPDSTVAAAAELRLPIVETLHGMHTLFAADWAAENRRAASISRLVAVSELNRQQYLLGNPGYPADRVVTIPNGVDEDREPPADRETARALFRLEPRDFVFVSLARYCLQKNSYGLLLAFDEVAREHPEAHLVIAGRPDDAVYTARTLQLRDQLAGRDRIHLLDHCPDPNLLLGAADGFVLDSFFEGWALASMEAMAAGVRVVVSDVGGAAEQVGDDPRRGFLVPNPVGGAIAADWESIRTARYAAQTNRTALVGAMRALITERDDWLTYRSWLADESGSRFAIQRCVASHADILREVAALATA